MNQRKSQMNESMIYDIDFNSLDGGDWAEMFDSHDGFNGACEWLSSQETEEEEN